MTEPKSHTRKFHFKLLLLALISLAAAQSVVFGVLAAPPKTQSEASQTAATQPPIPDWQTKAGSKMSFDVVSVKQNMSGPPPSGDIRTSNIPMNPGDDYAPTGGLFRATNWPLGSYIGFAYKANGPSTRAWRSELAKWAFMDSFDIEARAQGNPTKDQIRLMVQSALADRFKLVVHYELRQTPVFELVLDKPGKIGPSLQTRPETAPCSDSTTPPAFAGAFTPNSTAAGGQAACGQFLIIPAARGHLRVGARGVSAEVLASSLNGISGLDRPIVDQTGLSGNFDFIFEYVPPPINQGAGANVQPVEPELTFAEAVKEQLGLKLIPQTVPMDVLVIDHVEEPSAN